MKLELDLNDSDMKIIKDAKRKDTKIDDLTLSVIGDIVLSNIKNKNGE